jgi:hypothetical protein
LEDREEDEKIRWSLEKLVVKVVGGTGSGLYPVAGYDISGVKIRILLPELVYLLHIPLWLAPCTLAV